MGDLSDSRFEDGVLTTPETLSDAFDRVCGAFSDRPAFVENSGFEVTFERFYYTVHSLADALSRRGLSGNKTVAIGLPDIVIKIAMSLAAMRLGMKVLFVDSAKLSDGAAPSGVDAIIVADPGQKSFPKRQLVEASWLAPAPGPVAPIEGGAILTTTSGTTGEPRTQIYTDTVFMARRARGEAEIGRPTGPAIIGYNSSAGVGFQHILRALLAGQMQLHLGQGIPFVLNTLRGKQVAEAAMPPIALKIFVLEAQKANGELHIAATYLGGASVGKKLAQTAREVFQGKIFSSYGSSETGHVAIRELTGAEEFGTVGRIMSNLDWRFRNIDDGSDAERGELRLRIPKEIRKSNYIGTPGPYDEDGWVNTGDVGYINDDGLLVLEGRVGQFLNIGGQKAAPERYEKLVLEMGHIIEAAAFTTPQDSDIDRLQIAIVAAPEFDPTKFVDSCGRSFLARLPVDAFLVDELPYNSNGKLDRAEAANIRRRAVVFST